jgi:hypothetical protein
VQVRAELGAAVGAGAQRLFWLEAVAQLTGSPGCGDHEQEANLAVTDAIAELALLKVLFVVQ